MKKKRSDKSSVSSSTGLETEYDWGRSMQTIESKKRRAASVDTTSSSSSSAEYDWGEKKRKSQKKKLKTKTKTKQVSKGAKKKKKREISETEGQSLREAQLDLFDVAACARVSTQEVTHLPRWLMQCCLPC